MFELESPKELFDGFLKTKYKIKLFFQTTLQVQTIFLKQHYKHLFERLLLGYKKITSRCSIE